jgi:DNA replication protein DnaC
MSSIEFFSPSVNIIRDKDKKISYVVTKNAIKVANQILSDFNSKIHSFSIVGSYGTGKSSFIWAFEQNLQKKAEYFFTLNGQFNGHSKFEILNIVGSYGPIEDIVSKSMGLRKTDNISDILTGFQRYCAKVRREGKFLMIVIDEFGKLLEYAAQNNPEERMYFIQQFTEIVNDPDSNILLINTLHQNFNSYSNSLSNEQKQEWNKVRGRYVEISFNEPIEQLLFLASSQIKKWNLLSTSRIYNQSRNDAILGSGLMIISDEYAKKIHYDLLPLDLLSATILTEALQQYGQNERSLFTLLAKRDDESLYKFAETSKAFDLGVLYDFLTNNFFSDLFDKYNRDKNRWDRIKISLDRVSSYFDDKCLAARIVKIIGLLNIYSNKGGKLNLEFLKGYVGHDDVESVLSKLQGLKIVLYRKHLSSFTLTEGTDFDYFDAIEQAASKINTNVSPIEYLNRYYNLPIIHAKEASYTYGTPRFFEYKIVDELLDEASIGEIDGHIYLIFDPDMQKKNVKEFSKRSKNASIYVLFQRTHEINRIIQEIQKVEYVTATIENDKVAAEELALILDSLRSDLNNEVLVAIHSKVDDVKWYQNGKEITINSERDINRLLSSTIREVYSKTPKVRNELINKHKLSSAISIARKTYIRALIYNSSEKDLGFDDNKYPPEKTIYWSLLRDTGIHSQDKNGNYSLQSPQEEGIKALWDISQEFLSNSLHEQKPLSTLIDILSKPPFKIKGGFLQFWIPTFLIANRDEFALFKDGNYIPFLTDEVFDIMHKNPGSFSIRSYPTGGIELKVFNQYRKLFDISEDLEINNQTILEAIKPFLLFYRQLPRYAQCTEQISPQAKKLREAISSATDPYSAFFVHFPKALGYNISNSSLKGEKVEEYISDLKKAINELRAAYRELIERIEYNISKIISLEKDKMINDSQVVLRSRFQGIEIERLSPIHAKVLKRIRKDYDRSEFWIESLALSIIDKPLREFSDNDVEKFYSDFSIVYQDILDILPMHLSAGDLKNDAEILGAKFFDASGKSKSFQALNSQQSKQLAEKIGKEVIPLIKDLKLNKSEKKSVILNLINTLLNESEG